MLLFMKHCGELIYAGPSLILILLRTEAPSNSWSSLFFGGVFLEAMKNW